MVRNLMAHLVMELAYYRLEYFDLNRSFYFYTAIISRKLRRYVWPICSQLGIFNAKVSSQWSSISS